MADLLSYERLIVNQKAKLIELTNEYKIRDENGNDIGIIRQEGQSKARKALRLLSNIDSMLPTRLSVYDTGGQKVAGLHRGFTWWRSKLDVVDGAGNTVGRLAQRNLFGKVRFDIEGVGGMPLGQLRAENWRAWNFTITDTSGAEVARVTKKWAGLGKELFTTADNYVIELTPRATGSLRLVALAAAAGIDTAVKQFKAASALGG